MAALATPITVMGSTLNSVTYTRPTHKATHPRLLLQKRTYPVNDGDLAVSQFDIVQGSTDPEGLVTKRKVHILVKVSYPTDAAQADIDDAVAFAKDLVQSDEFTSSVSSQAPIK